MSKKISLSPMKTKSLVALSKKLIFLSIIVFCFHMPAIADDSKKMADGFFYNNQYQKAVTYYLRTLEKDNSSFAPLNGGLERKNTSFNSIY